MKDVDRKIAIGCLISVTITIVGILLIPRLAFPDLFDSPTIPSAQTATPSLYLTAVPQIATVSDIERALQYPLPTNIQNFKGVLICFIECDYAAKFDALPDEVGRFIEELNLSSLNRLQPNLSPFDASLGMVSFLEWWAPQQAQVFMGNSGEMTPQVLVDQTNEELYTVYIVVWPSLG